MTELLEFLVRSLVEDPSAVVVEELEEEGDLVYEISVAEDDLGQDARRATAGADDGRRTPSKGAQALTFRGLWQYESD